MLNTRWLQWRTGCRVQRARMRRRNYAAAQKCAAQPEEERPATSAAAPREGSGTRG
jgi:hypothetical protein